MSNTEQEQVNPEDKLNDLQKQIWDAVKNRKVEYYGLPDLTVKDICSPLPIDPMSLYVSLKGPASLVSIEATLLSERVESFTGEKVPRFLIERKDRFGVITKNTEVK